MHHFGLDIQLNCRKGRRVNNYENISILLLKLLKKK